ncbi:MAG: bifunctional alpha,alpha-trehalose-phosphate synthase (UDP-forming)/trehalose-phosphatase [bacterium]
MQNSGSPSYLIVSNRLPVQFDPATGGLTPAAGGLVTALRGARLGDGCTWVGALPATVDRDAWRQATAEPAPGEMRYRAVFVEPDTYDRYYNGMCNDVLWPLLHYEPQSVRFDPAAWDAYRAVNQQFAETIADAAPEGARVWIHDLHLFLLPALLRAARPDLRTGFFLHVPFPSSELFRQLPVRRAILESVIEADLVGFHDYDYLRHFCTALRVVLGHESNLLSVTHPSADGEARTTALGVFPVSIDTADFAEDAAAAAVIERVAAMRRATPGMQTVLGVDRLDYMKGLDLKLDAFEALLAAHPELHGHVRLMQLAVPSRTEVPEYMRLRDEIERRVGQINGRFGTPEWVPVHYLFTSVDRDELLALYRLADVLLVSSKRDGMNLVALEYIAAQDPTDPGVVCLSEFAGCISILSHVIPINPWDATRSGEALHEALTMPSTERIARHAPMLDQLRRYDAARWAQSYLDALDRDPAPARAPRAPAPDADALAADAIGHPLVVCLDYDGTLVPIVEHPEDAVITDPVRDAVARLAAHDAVHVIVVSGRSVDFLATQFEGLPVALAPEHGACYRLGPADPWHTLVRHDTALWMPIAQKLIEDFRDRTPGSEVEAKRHAIAWHYRRSPARFADHQARRLALELDAALGNLPAQVLSGKKVIEARAIEADKGAFLRWIIDESFGPEAQVIAIGDDATDEDLFAAVPAGGVSVKVGDAPSRATHRVRSQAEVVPFLTRLADALDRR